MDGIDGDVALLVAEHHGAQHHIFRQLISLGLDHQHGRLGACHHEVELGLGQLSRARVEHVFAIDVGHTSGTDRAVERNARDRQRGAGSDHGGDVGRHLRVERQHVNHELHFVVETLGEQGADRAVDQARGERLEFAGLGFTLEEAAGDLAGGVGLLDVVNGQREEVLTRLGVLGADHGGQHRGAVHVDYHGARGLASDLAGFHRDRVLAPLEGLGDFVEHAHACVSIGSQNAPLRRRAIPGVKASSVMPFQRDSPAASME